MHRQVRIAHRAPPQVAQKQGRHREVSQKHQNTTESAPRERQGTPTMASGAAQGTQEEASRAQKTPRKQYSGALAVPKSKTYTLATSQRQEKTHPKLPRASQRAPNEGPMRPTSAQESSKRGSKGRQGHPKGSIVAPSPPQNGTKMEVQRVAKKSRKSDNPRKHANLDSTHYLPHFAHIRHPRAETAPKSEGAFS